jgi:hypothetical protein
MAPTMRPRFQTPARRARAGSPLVGVLLIVFISSAVAAVMIGNAIGSVRLTDRQARLEIAHFAAEAGLEEGFNWASRTWGFVPTVNQFSRSLSNGATVDYTVTVQDLAKKDFEISATGNFRGVSRRLTIGRPVYPTYATYGRAAIASGTGYFVAGSVYYGRVHGDTALHIWSYNNPNNTGPDFHGLVTTSAADFIGPWQWARFFAGYEFNAPNLKITEVDFDEYLAKAQGMEATNLGGMVLEGPTEIFFYIAGNGQGKMAVKNVRKFNNDNYRIFNSEDFNLLYVKDALTVVTHPTTGESVSRRGDLTVHGGVLDGKMSVYNDGDVFLTQSLTYRNDPRDDNAPVRDFPQSSDDRIGFISKDDIWINRMDTGKGNMDLFGAFLATGIRPGSAGNMGLLDYRNTAVGPLGTLTRYGSFVSKTFYPIGTFNSTTGALRSGFHSVNYWDPRFVKNPPPFYPPDRTQHKIVDWQVADVAAPTVVPTSPTLPSL